MSTTPAELTRLAFFALNSSLAIPATPAALVARMANESLVYTPNVVESPELDPSGQLRDSILVGSSSAGNVEFPLVRSTWFHAMLEAAFRNTWGTGTKGVYNGGTLVWDDTPVGANELIPGRLVKLFGAEKTFGTPDANSYHLFDLVGVGSLNLRVQPNEVLMGSVALMGGTMTPSGAGVVDATYPDPGTYRPFTSPNVTEVDLEGLAAAQCFNSMTLNFNSNLKGIPCIGSEADREKALGRFVPTFDGTTHFLSNEHVLALKAQTSLELNVTLTDGSGNAYNFFYPMMKFTSAPVTTPGSNQEVMQPISLRGHYSPDHKYSCLVTRTLVA